MKPHLLYFQSARFLIKCGSFIYILKVKIGSYRINLNNKLISKNFGTSHIFQAGHTYCIILKYH